MSKYYGSQILSSEVIELQSCVKMLISAVFPICLGVSPFLVYQCKCMRTAVVILLNVYIHFSPG